MLDSAATACGALDLADRLWVAFDLQRDPGAVFALMDALGRAVETGRSTVSNVLARSDWGEAIESLLRLCGVFAEISSDERRRLENPMRASRRSILDVQVAPVLASFTTEPPTHLRRQIDIVRLLLLLHVLGNEAPRPFALVVADALRKATTVPVPWAAVVGLLPSPEPNSDWRAATLALVSDRRRLESLARDKVSASEVAHFADALRLLIGSLEGISIRSTGGSEERLGTIARSEPPPSDEPLGDQSGVERTAASRPARSKFVSAGVDVESIELLQSDANPKQDAAPVNGLTENERKTQTYRLIEVDQLLRFDWDHVNAYDLSVLGNALRTDLQAPVPHAGCLVAAFALATSVPVEKVPRVPIGRPAASFGALLLDGTWQRAVLRPPRSWTPEAGHAICTHLIASCDHLALELPESLRAALTRALTIHPGVKNLGELLGPTARDPVAALSDWLAPLRAAHPSARLTHGRISRALGVEVMAISHDPAAVHFLTSTESNVAPVSCYYSAFTHGNLATIYQQALARLFGHSASTADLKALGFVGPLGVPTEAAIGSFGSCLRDRIAAARGLIDIHNAYVAYTLWLMLLGTGHRPVNDPFDQLSALDLDRGWANIDDKRSTASKAGRIVPLCETVILTLRHYISHLGALARIIEPSQPALASAIRAVLAGSSSPRLPRFFFIEPSGRLTGINRAWLERSMGPLFGLTPNFGRRVIESFAIASGIAAEIVNEVLGHVELGQPACGAGSPLGPADLADCGRMMGKLLARCGWGPLGSPLLNDEAPQLSNNEPQTRCTLPRGPFGQQRRAAEAAQERETVRRRAREILDEVVGGRRLSQLTQADVDEAFSRISSGIQTSLAAILTQDRLYTLLARCKQRFSLEIALPKRIRPAADADAAFPFGSVARWQIADAYQRELLAVLRSRSRSGAVTVHRRRALAEAAISLVAHSLITDREVLLHVAAGGPLRLLDADSLGIFGEVAVPRRGGTETRRFRLHAVTSLLIARLNATARVQQTSGGEDCGKELMLLDSQVRGRLNIHETLPSIGAAVTWLCSVFEPLAALSLPGNVAGHMSGRTGAVNLPLDDLVSILTGHCPPLVYSEIAIGEFESHRFIDQPEPVRATGGAKPVASALPKSSLRLHKQIARLLDVARNPNSSSHNPSSRKHHSAQAKEILIPRLGEIERSIRNAPDFAWLLLRWLVHLLTLGVGDDGRALRASSCSRYYFALAPRLIHCFGHQTIRDITAEQLEAGYARFVDSLPSESQPYAFARLVEFHRYLVERHGLPRIDWSDFAPPSALGAVSVDAGFITWEEYEQTLEVLLADPSVDLRERYLQAMVWLLIYRFGARVSEAVCLRRRDLILHGGDVIALFRPSRYRDSKSNAGIRQVPLIGPLSATERSLVDRWCEHADELAAGDTLAALFAELDRGRVLVDTRRLLHRITTTLRRVTGRPHLHLHHGRHSFGSRLELLMTLEEVPRDSSLASAIRRITGPCEPRQIRQLLLDQEARSKRGVWAASGLLGHSGTFVSQRVYFHLSDIMSAAMLEGVFDAAAVKIDRHLLVYLTGTRENTELAADGMQSSDDLCRKCVAAQIVRIESLAQPLPATPASIASATDSGTTPPPQTPLSLTDIDRVLDLLHRRGQLEEAAQVLLLPLDAVRELAQADREVRRQSHYGVEDSRWLQVTPVELRHARSGSRSPSETARVRKFLTELDARSHRGDVEDLSAVCAQIWMSRYRHDSTPLVLANIDELHAFLRWAEVAGIEQDELLLRAATEKDREELIGALRRMRRGGLPIVTVDSGLKRPRLGFRGAGGGRVGLQLRESSDDGLRGMHQLHRVCHVVACSALLKS
jgi:integrase